MGWMLKLFESNTLMVTIDFQHIWIVSLKIKWNDLFIVRLNIFQFVEL